MRIQEELKKLKTEDGISIALWKSYRQNESSGKNIFLTHGTFSNKRIFAGIVEYLVDLGYVCWVLEWRSHGSSMKSKTKFDFETIGLLDIKTAFIYLIDTFKINNINCITHSGGGIALTIFLLKNREYRKYVSRITMFNCQSFGAVNSINDYLKILTAKYLSFILGYVPGIKLGLGEHNEKYAIMKQWFDWNLKREFKGKSGIDYLENMPLIEKPVLSICAEGDHFIAPKEGCEIFLNGFKNPNNKFVICSIENGFSENYNHSRTILSKNASKEIWKIVLNWIENEENCLS